MKRRLPWLASLDGRGSTDTVALATGEDFPDALSGGVHSAQRGVPLLLTGRDTLPTSTTSFLLDARPEKFIVYGGENAISDNVVEGAVTASCALDPERCDLIQPGPTTGVIDAPLGTVYVSTLSGVKPEDIVGSVPAAMNVDGGGDFGQTTDPGSVLLTWKDSQGSRRLARANRLKHINERGHNIALHTIVKTTQLESPEQDPRDEQAVLYETFARLWSCNVLGGFIPLQDCEIVADEEIRVVYLELEFADGQDWGLHTAYCINETQICPDWVNQYMNHYPRSE